MCGLWLCQLDWGHPGNFSRVEKCILQGREVTSLHCESVEVRLPVVGLGY